jgi:arylsulfatase
MRRAMEQGVFPHGGDPMAFLPVAPLWDSLSVAQQQRYARAQELSAAMLEYLDQSIGQIVEYLDQSGELDNTVIMFMSDHGASATEIGVDPTDRSFAILAERDNSIENFGRLNSFVDHGRGFGEAASAPFKYFKGTLYEGGLRAAAFVRYPREIAGGNVSHSYMTVMDILPTFLEIAGTEHPGESEYNGRAIHGIQGRSAWAHLTGNASNIHSPTDTAGWTQGDGGAVIKGAYKLINRPPVGQSASIPWRLYDLGADPGETQDLAARHPDITADLIGEWEARWR